MKRLTLDPMAVAFGLLLLTAVAAGGAIELLEGRLLDAVFLLGVLGVGVYVLQRRRETALEEAVLPEDIEELRKFFDWLIANQPLTAEQVIQALLRYDFLTDEEVEAAMAKTEAPQRRQPRKASGVSRPATPPRTPRHRPETRRPLDVEYPLEEDEDDFLGDVRW